MGEAYSRWMVLFEQALSRLDEALARSEDAIVRDACIHSQLLRGLLDRLKEGESRRAREGR